MLFNLMVGVSSENETLVRILLGVDTAILAILVICLIWWAIWKLSHRKKADDTDEQAGEPDYTLVPKGMMLLPIDYNGVNVTAVREESVASEAVTGSENTVEIDENTVVVTKPQRKTLDEAYEELSSEQKGFFDGLLSYAMSKEQAIENRTKTEVQVKAERKQIVRLAIKRGITIAKFHLENDLMKQYRKNDAETKISVKDTEIKVTDVAAYETAKGLVDVAIENNKREKEAAAEARRQQRAEKRRAAKQAEAE